MGRNKVKPEQASKVLMRMPVRRVMIPKANGGERPLGIPTIRDRVIQTAAKIVIEPIFEADFEDNAYGYRPARGAVDAVKEVHRHLCRGYLRDNPEALKTVLTEQGWVNSARELDLYTGRFRHESDFLTFAKGILETMDIPVPALSPVATDDYLSKGHAIDLTNRQIETMRNERMTGDKIDKLFDQTERRMDEKRAIEKSRARAEGKAPNTISMSASDFPG